MKLSLNIAGTDYSLELNQIGNQMACLRLERGHTKELLYAIRDGHADLSVWDPRIPSPNHLQTDDATERHFDIDVHLVRGRIVLDLVSPDRSVRLFQVML